MAPKVRSGVRPAGGIDEMWGVTARSCSVEASEALFGLDFPINYPLRIHQELQSSTLPKLLSKTTRSDSTMLLLLALAGIRLTNAQSTGPACVVSPPCKVCMAAKLNSFRKAANNHPHSL